MKYDWLEKKAKEFIRDLQWAEKDACCEDEYEKIVDIAEEVLEGIPTTLVQKDWFARYGVVSRLPDPLKHDSKLINKLMEYLYDNDTICFDNDIAERLDYDTERFLESNNGLQEQTKD